MTDNVVDVKITAQTADFVAGVEKAESSFKGMSTTINAHAGLIREHLNLGKEAVTLFAEAFVVEKIREWGEEVGHAAEQIERVAQMTGLSTDAVQEFNFAVTMSGGSAESAATTIERLEKNMVEAGNKTSQAALAFQAMGIATKDATGNLRPVQAVLNDVANYFHSTADGATKTALAMQIMGRGGAQLIPVLNKGQEGLAALNKELDETNSKMSGSQIEKFGELDQSLKLLEKSWEGFKQAVVEYFEPAYNLIVEGITKVIQIVTEGINKVNQFTDAVSHVGFGAPKKEEEEHGGGKPQAATPKTAQEIAAAKQLAEQRLAIARDTAMIEIEVRNQENAHLLAMGEISNQQFLAQELKISQAKTKILHDYYNGKQALAKGDAEKEAKAKDETIKAATVAGLEMQKIRDKQSEDAIKDFNMMSSSVITGFQGMTEKLIRGTSTFRDAFKSMCGDLIVEFAKMQVANVAKALWAAAVGKGISISTAIMERGANAVKAASATYASVASIPLVGWALAPVAAAGAFAGVMAFGLPSAAGGWGEVPNDGLAMIHKKEMVLPAALAEKVRNMSDGGNRVTMNISTPDAQSFRKNMGQMMADMHTNLKSSQRNN